ncbi:MAG: hypothetical protein FJ088_13815, partial [Deltaproteobacteria bacterium]|nr:hypothetical protein [Deltaproteobacteria bacterium]
MGRYSLPFFLMLALSLNFCGTTDDSSDAIDDFYSGDYGWDGYTDENFTPDYGNDNYIPGDTITPTNEFPSAELLLKITGPSGNGRAIVMGAVTSVTGVVFGKYDSLSWASSSGQKGNAAGAPFWQTDAISLNPGDNFITVTAQNGSETATDTVMITYNPGFLFDGPVNLRPSALFSSENTKVVVTIPLGRYINFDSNSVQLLQVDAFGNTIKNVGVMKDDGAVASSGDEIAKDGIYTLFSNFTCGGDPIYVRVAVTAKFSNQNYQALSAIGEIECVSHLTANECTSHQKLLIGARDKYFEELNTNGTTAARQAARDLL